MKWQRDIYNCFRQEGSLSPPSEDTYPIVPLEDDEDENLESFSMIGNNMQ